MRLILSRLDPKITIFRTFKIKYMKKIINKNEIQTVGSDSTVRYQEEISKDKYSPLDQETTEKMIAMFKQGDYNARNILINRNLRFAFLVAKNYQHIDRSLNEVISCANLGLINGVDRSINYDSSRGMWTTYIVSSIQGAILNEFFSKSSLIKKPKEINIKYINIEYANHFVDHPDVTGNACFIHFDQQSKLETESLHIDLKRILKLYPAVNIHALFLKQGVLVKETLLEMHSLIGKYAKLLTRYEEKVTNFKEDKKFILKLRPQKGEPQGKTKREREVNRKLLRESIELQEKDLIETRKILREYKLFCQYFNKQDVSFYLERKDDLKEFLPDIFGVGHERIRQAASRGVVNLRRAMYSNAFLKKYLGTSCILDELALHN